MGVVIAALAASERCAAWLLFMVGLVLCWIADPLHLPLLADNQHYYFIAERAAAGVPPHLSQFDPKHALSMLMTAAAMLLGRELGLSDVVAARALSVAVTAVCMPLVWLVARRLTGSVLAAWLSSVAMIGFWRFVVMGAMGARPKVFMVLFILLTFLWLCDRRPLLAGLAAAGAFLCWQPAAIAFAAGAPALLLGPSRWKNLALYAIGAAVPIAVYHGYFVWTGAFAEQIEQAYRFPSSFLESFPPPVYGVRLHAIWILAVKNGPGFASIVPLTALAGVLIVWARGIWRPRWIVAAVRAEPGWLCLLSFAHAALLFSLCNYQGFPDRFLLEPLMAIGAGSTCAALVATCSRWSKRAAVPIAMVAGVWLALPVVRAEYRIKSHFDIADQQELGEEVSRMLDDGESVWAVGCTHLLAFAHTNNFLPYGFFFRGVEQHALASVGRAPYLPLRGGELPDVILWSRSKLRDVTRWLPFEYRQEHSPRFRAQGIHVWRRRSGAETPAFSLRSRAREAVARSEELRP